MQYSISYIYVRTYTYNTYKTYNTIRYDMIRLHKNMSCFLVYFLIDCLAEVLVQVQIRV